MFKKLLQFIFGPIIRRAQNKENFYKTNQELEKALNPDEAFLKDWRDSREGQENLPEVEMHLDTGKIIFPNGMSEEEKKEIEAAMEELHQNLQKFAPEELYKSLEDFMQNSGKAENFKLWEGLTKVNEDEEALTKIKEEMDFCEENTEHWNDADFAEALYELEGQGYTFTGVEEIYRKVNEKLELSPSESKQIRAWYKLATQEFVYEA